MTADTSIPRDELGDHLISEILEYGISDAEEIARIFTEAVRDVVPKAAKDLKRGMEERAPEALDERREMEEGFQKRLYDTWKPALDRLHQIIAISEEVGTEILEEAHASGEEESPKTQAIVGLHIRGVRVAKQVRSLLLAGFAGGALSRWRTLYELTVVADLLAEHGEELSERYLNHSIYMARKDMRQYERYQDALGFEPVTEAERDRMDTSVSELEERYGEAFADSDYGWAAEALDERYPHFGHLLDAVEGLKKLKPFRNMAHDTVHAGSKALVWSLHSPDKENQDLTSAASNYGLADPGQLTGHLLVILNLLLITQHPTVDRLVTAHALAELQEEVKQEFGRIQQEVREKWESS